MTKDEVLGHLKDAKSAHIAWVQRAKLLVEGLNIDENSIPVNSTECNFGQWFYSKGQILNALSNNPVSCMSNIERLHFELHGKYLQIFTIYFNKPKSHFLARLLSAKKKHISAYEIQVAKNYYEELEEISKLLLEEINRLERRVVAVPEEKNRAFSLKIDQRILFTGIR